jgi:hypothetical protein
MGLSLFGNEDGKIRSTDPWADAAIRTKFANELPFF